MTNSNYGGNSNSVVPLIQGPLLGYTPEMLLSTINTTRSNNLHLNNNNNNNSPLTSHTSLSQSASSLLSSSSTSSPSSFSYLSPRSSDVYLICKNGQNYCYTSISNRNICKSYVEKAIQYLAKYENGSLTCEYITPNENVNFK